MSNLIADWRDRPTHRRVWALAAPMILSNISVPLVALVDSTVIGHLPHAHQLGAVAVGASLYTFLAWAMGFLRMGSTGFAAQAAGRSDGAALRQILLQGCCWRWDWRRARHAGRAVERRGPAFHAAVGGT
jgi:MATE family multidrug resistance protein